MIESIEYIECYVKDALKTVREFKKYFGFQLYAERRISTSLNPIESYILKQGEIYLIFTSSQDPSSSIFNYVNKYGESVVDIAFCVTSLRAIQSRLRKNEIPITPHPMIVCPATSQIQLCRVETGGIVSHTLVERNTPLFSLSGYNIVDNFSPTNTPIITCDHVAIAVDYDTLDKWASVYGKLFNFHITQRENILTQHSGMKSLVITSENNRVKFPLVAPYHKNSNGQIENFLQTHKKPGVQHIAFLTNNIIESVTSSKNNGVKFLDVPNNYYDDRPKQYYELIDKELYQQIKDLNLLVEYERDQFLLQTFTQPLFNKPPFFVEMIQRYNHDGFGSKNIEALFKSIEKSQALKKDE